MLKAFETSKSSTTLINADTMERCDIKPHCLTEIGFQIILKFVQALAILNLPSERDKSFHIQHRSTCYLAILNSAGPPQLYFCYDGHLLECYCATKSHVAGSGNATPPLN